MLLLGFGDRQGRLLVSPKESNTFTRVCWYRVAECLSVRTKTRGGGELVFEY